MRSLVDELWAPDGLSAAGIGPDEDSFRNAVEGVAGETARGMIKVAVAGAAGRMGATTCAAVEGAEDMELTGRADPTLGTSLDDVLADADVLVDFTLPDQAVGNARMAVAGRRARRRSARPAGPRTTCAQRSTARPARSSPPPTSRSAPC